MLALLLPGQGSQEVGMGRDICGESAGAREVFERADEALGFSISKLCFEGDEEAQRPTEVQQPAILTTSIAMLTAFQERFEPKPSYLVGHSLGEYTALVASRALELEDAVRLVHARGRFMQEAVADGQGAMAAVLGCPSEAVEEACAAAIRGNHGIVQPANYNAPTQTVIAGQVGAVEFASTEARRLGAKRVVPLQVSAPFHCPLMEPAAERLAGLLAEIRWQNPFIPVVGNVEAEPYQDAEAIAPLLRAQVTAPVRFTQSVKRLAALGVSRVVEVGPGRVLSGLVARIERRLARASVGDAASLGEVGDFLAGGER